LKRTRRKREEKREKRKEKNEGTLQEILGQIILNNSGKLGKEKMKNRGRNSGKK
jgi:hypothetical protein